MHARPQHFWGLLPSTQAHRQCWCVVVPASHCHNCIVNNLIPALTVCACCPHAAGPATCTLVLSNTGEVDLASITVSGQTSCTPPQPLAAGTNFSCDINKAILQGDFNTWDEHQQAVAVSITATATPSVSRAQPSPVVNSTEFQLELTSLPDLLVTNLPATPSVVGAAGGLEMLQLQHA